MACLQPFYSDLQVFGQGWLEFSVCISINLEDFMDAMRLTVKLTSSTFDTERSVSHVV